MTEKPRIILAPMHGYADFVMRDILTQIGGFDEVVSEFVRITHTVHAPKTWLKNIPELKNNGKTASGVPCTVQLLGSDADNLALNAINAVACGASKIDLNFGCPAKTVNRHQGGAILLNNPTLIEHIVRTVRQRLPENIVLSAKMRLGVDDCHLALDCARAIAHAGANEIAVHARTKAQAYQPPAHWDYFAKIQEVIDIPLIANGDIFSLADVQTIHQLCQPAGFMLGRGVLMNPFLAQHIQRASGDIDPNHDWQQLLPYLKLFFAQCQTHRPNGQYATARLKQWLAMLATFYPTAQTYLQHIRPITCPQKMADYLQSTIEN